MRRSLARRQQLCKSAPVARGNTIRIRSAAEARAVHNIQRPAPPIPAAGIDFGRDVLPPGEYGVPISRLLAYLVVDATAPELVAEFSCRLVVMRQGRKLVERTTSSRSQAGRLSQWVIWGQLVEAAEVTMIVGSLTVDPYLPGYSGDESPAGRGVSAELLRLVSPASIAAEASAHILKGAHEHSSRGTKIPPRYQTALERLKRLRPPNAPTPDSQIEQIAIRYLQLFDAGVKQPLPVIAAQFGITREQARDRVSRAREMKYLQPGKPGRAGATPGERLIARYPKLAESKGGKDA